MESVNETGTPMFGVQDRHSAGTTALKAVGRLVTGAGAGHPAWQTERDWRGTSRVVIDLASVTAIDAGGIGALLRLRQSAAGYGVPVTIRAAAPRVRRVLQLCGLDGVFGLPTTVPGTERRSVPGAAFHALWRCA